ncbi:DUF2231 domain-containing protein [Arachidicoccus sp.]|uniref:DUF2231 domain-containing protein n=1 Tax=Arachidicoccus sp. TaxID=1872624 RepID=UPI003D25DBF6
MRRSQKRYLTAILSIMGIFIAVASLAQVGNDTISTIINHSYPAAHNTGTLADFPKLHPLVVHFPIVFLILAFFTQIVSLFVYKKELSWVTLFLVVLGFIGAYLASNLFHGGDPNPSLLDPITRITFQRHEQYATYTVWLSAVAAFIKIVSHFFFKRKLITEILATFLLAGAAYTITVTGDLGARLVHIDALGVQGNQIPAQDDM